MSIPLAADPVPQTPEVNIRDYLDIIRRRRAIFIQVFVMVLTVGVVWAAMEKPTYETTAKLNVPRPQNTLTMIESANPISVMLMASQPDQSATQVETMQSSDFRARAFERARKNGLTERQGVPRPTFRVSVGEDNQQIILITASGGDPHDVQKLADAVLDEHLETLREDQSGGLRATLKQVQKWKAKAFEDLNAAEDRLARFKRRNRIEQLLAEQSARDKEYVDLKTRIAESEANVVTTSARLRALSADLRGMQPYIEQETTVPNPKFTSLHDQLADLTKQRQELLSQYKEHTRPILDLDEKIAKVEERLKTERMELITKTPVPNPLIPPLEQELAQLRASQNGHEAVLNAAKAQFRTRQEMLNSLGSWEVDLHRMTQDRDRVMAAYKMLSERESELQLRLEAQPTVAKVIQRGELPANPVRPNRRNNVILSVIIALFLGAAMAFLQEFMDDRINSPDDLDRITALPTLGHVPLIGEEQSRLVSALPANSHVAESYRALRASIGFAGIDSPIRLLQVTSPSKGEGKTVTSVNLATAMAMDGKKVILVDADLRRPSLHRVLHVANGPGLSEVLVGLKSIDEALQPTAVENLQVMCAGPIPPNPAELLGSRAFDTLLEELEPRADIIIFDTPPCIPVTDPLVVATRMDGVILVLHAGQTRRGAVKHVEELLARARARIVGVVFNRVQHSKSGYYYYHYYYYYGDGYYSSDPSGPQRRHRRNGKGRSPGLGAGSSVAARTSDEARDGND